MVIGSTPKRGLPSCINGQVSGTMDMSRHVGEPFQVDKHVTLMSST